MKLEVVEVKKETPSIITIKFKKENLEFKAGQYLVYKLDVKDPKGKSRSFSMANSPTEENTLLSYRVSDSLFKQKLSTLKPGDKIEVLGPLGHFSLIADQPAVMLSGGIGITPLRSMIKYATDKKLKTKITLFYANRNPDEIAFKKEFDEMQKNNKNLKIVYTVDSADGKPWKGNVGYIDDKLISLNVKDYKSCKFYICGPPKMVEIMTGLLQKMKIPEESIITEHFGGY